MQKKSTYIVRIVVKVIERISTWKTTSRKNNQKTVRQHLKHCVR